MTYGDLIRAYIPDADEKTVEYILWEKTAYPCADAAYCEQQIADFVGVPNKHIVDPRKDGE